MAEDAHEVPDCGHMSDETWPALSSLGEDSADDFKLYSPTSSDTLSISGLFSDAASSNHDSANEVDDYIEDSTGEKAAAADPAPAEEGPYSSQQLLSTRDVVEALTSKLLFGNDCFEVRPFSMSGAGGFARRDLAPGEIVLLEQPILRSSYETLFRDFQCLDAGTRSVFFQLFSSNHFDPKRVAIEAIWSTNCFSVSVDCQGLFAIGSRFNHACAPSQNLEYRFDPTTGCMIFSVGANPVKAGDELTISYGFGLRPIDLYYRYGFRCWCGACAGLTDEEISMSSIW